MTWLEKIPPMVSALALGYGVGMSAPDSTIVRMRSAVGEHRGSALQQPNGYPLVAPQPHAWAGWGPTGEPAQLQGRGPLRGPQPPWDALATQTESRELARLREGNHDGGAHSCKLHEPIASEPPAFASYAREDAFGDVDDLDPAGVEALSRLQLPDFNVPITRRAIRYVRFLTRSNRGRGLFESWLKRSGRYQDMVVQTLREWQLPEDLIWVAMIESGFDPAIRSPAGAVGLWQFMQQTGEVYGLDVDRFVDQRKNPQEATRAAAHHLRDLYQRFGDWQLALAAYNMGYEQLLSAIDTYNTSDFSELARQRAIPKETSNYVPKIVAAALVANNLERYGFGDVKLYKPLSPAEIAVPGGAKLSTVAKAAGITTAQLRKYNPHLLTATVPTNRRELTLFIPADSLSRARAALPVMLDRRITLSDADILDPLDLLDRQGQKARKRRYHAWNEDENLLYALPKPKRRSLRRLLSNRQTTDDVAEEMPGVADEFTQRTDRETVMYRVGPGDTLIGVARQFAIDIDDLARDNKLDSDAKLQEGSLLRLSVKRDVLQRWKSRGAKDAKGEDRSRPKSRSGSRKKGNQAA